MKTSEIRAVGREDRDAEIGKLQKELLGLRCRIALGEDIKPSEVRRIRREIARMRTINREEELAAVAAPTTGSEKTT